MKNLLGTLAVILAWTYLIGSLVLFVGLVVADILGVLP